jgi:hypothetical protein
VCGAIEQVLRDHLHATVAAAQWAPPAAGGDLRPVDAWHHVPTLDALSSAEYPAGAIESPGLAAQPVQTSATTWDATWVVVVGVYDRGFDHDDTASRVRRWAAAVRATVLAHRDLGGLARTVTWTGEAYAQRPDRRDARGLGGCAVTFTVTVPNAVELPVASPSTPVPTVVTTHTNVSVS